MAVPVLSSVSPSSGPPGTAITCLGAGFDAGAQIGCPALVDTTFIGVGELRAAIPADLAGPGGASMQISVYVRNEDGSISSVLPFTVLFGRSKLQSWTAIAPVCAEIPGFKRGGAVPDSTIEGWIRSVAQQINGVLLRRGLPIDPAAWPAASADSAQPDAEAVLELINRYGAAARLASMVGAQFSAAGEWPLAKQLRADYDREFRALQAGEYDKLFLASAATEEPGAQFRGGDTDSNGDVDPAFTKERVF
jgi:hypothetical protein